VDEIDCLMQKGFVYNLLGANKMAETSY
jgi:hypothetical protein